MAVHAYNPNTKEAETRELPQVQSQSSLQYVHQGYSMSQLLSLSPNVHTHDK